MTVRGTRPLSGAATAIAAFSVVHGIILPAARKIGRLAQEALSGKQQPPGDIHLLQKRMRTGTLIVLALLVASLAPMVAAASL